MKAKLEPRKAGALPLPMMMNKTVPIPFMKRAMAGLMPKSIGTRIEAPNMAKRCWKLRGRPLAKPTFSLTWMMGRDIAISCGKSFFIPDLGVISVIPYFLSI
jgi:hypothetical protein